MTHRTFTTILACLLLAPACKGGDGGPAGKAGAKAGKADANGGGKADGKADAKTGPEFESLQVAEGSSDDPGPVPPEASMALFVVEGALLPLACFDQQAGRLLHGSKCLDLIPQGEDARIASETGSHVKKIGEPTEPLCTRGDGKKTAFSAADIDGGANFVYGAWPRSAFKTVTVVKEDTRRGESLQLSEEETAALTKATGKSGELRAHQVAEVDIDGDDAKSKIYSVFIPHPSQPERFTVSALFIAPNGDLGKLVQIDKSKSNEDVLEVHGVVDIDGDGTRELWTRLVFAEGSGDRVVQLLNWQPKPLGKWTCGV